jgi:CheY-like chemotaxis protein
VAARDSSAYQVFTALRSRILSGELAGGTRLSGRPRLVAEWRLSLYKVRQVETWLAAEGLIRVESGHGTFVQAPVEPAVLLVAAEAAVQLALVEYLNRYGYRLVAAASPAEGLEGLGQDSAVALVLIDVCRLTPGVGVDFIRRVRRRWPQIPLAVIVSDLDQLAPLRGGPEWPLLIMIKPIHTRQVDEVLRLTLPRVAPPSETTTASGSAVPGSVTAPKHRRARHSSRPRVAQ